MDVLLLAAGLRYAGGADLLTFEPDAGFAAVPFAVLIELLTLVAVVRVATAVLLLTPLLGAGELETAAELRLTLLLTLVPPLSDPPPAANLSEPV